MAASSAIAGPAPSGPRPGDSYAIMREVLSSERSDDQSTGSSTDRDVLVERVIAVRDDGVELEYDLPADSTAEERAPVWQFPVRIFRPNQGGMQLLNRAELETRVDAWLRKAKWSRAMCGRWIFTWDAFQIECDPQSVLETIESFDPSYRDLREGALYRDSSALEPAPLAMKSSGPEGSTFVAEMNVDPEAVRRSRAEADVVVGELMSKPTTLEAALRAHAADSVSGTITVTLEADSSGKVWRRRKVAVLRIKAADGPLTTRTTTETVERRPAS